MTHLALLQGPTIRIEPFTSEGLAKRHLLGAMPEDRAMPVRSEQLDDAVLVDLLTEHRLPPHWVVVVGDAAQRHENSSGIFVFPHEARGSQRTADALIAEVGCRGQWRAVPPMPGSRWSRWGDMARQTAGAVSFGVLLVVLGPIFALSALAKRRPLGKGGPLLLFSSLPFTLGLFLILVGIDPLRVALWILLPFALLGGASAALTEIRHQLWLARRRCS